MKTKPRISKSSQKFGSQSENPMPYGAEVVLRQAQHHMAIARVSLIALALSLAISLVLVMTVKYTVEKPVEVLSYLMDPDGRVVAVQPLRDPTLTDTQVLNWAKDRVVDLHSFTFTNYLREIEKLRPYFLDEAFSNYVTALKQSKIIAKIKKDNLLVTATPASAPIIVNKRVVDGAYTWTVQVPILQTIEGGKSGGEKTTLNATMVVQRVPRTTNLSGVNIRSYLVREGGGVRR